MSKMNLSQRSGPAIILTSLLVILSSCSATLLKRMTKKMKRIGLMLQHLFVFLRFMFLFVLRFDGPQVTKVNVSAKTAYLALDWKSESDSMHPDSIR